MSADGRIAVAISTTGDEHRIKFLETCVKHWDKMLPDSASLFITVDGGADACDRVLDAVDYWTLSVFRASPSNDRVGVAINKNTGLELMVDGTRAEHLFLCDDDTWPLNPLALRKHIELSEKAPHSMVVWGDSRFLHNTRDYASWTWPRGVLLYQTRAVVETVGGMDERFGPGGHEHAEWSRRIHQAGLTPDAFITPRVYSETGVIGRATRAGSFWHAEDMRRSGEHVNAHRHRRKRLTSIKRRDWATAEKIMVERDGDTSYVPFRARSNGRPSATLWTTSTGRGAGGDT